MNTHEPWYETEITARVERRLQEHYERHEPDPRFLARLEQDLARRAERRTRWRAWWRGRAVRLALAAVALLLLALLGTVPLGGPRQAWAQLLRLIGYVPGAGFVEVNETRVLPAPVTHTVGRTTVRVEQVVATSEDTRVRVHISGPFLSTLEELQDKVYLLTSTGKRLPATQYGLGTLVPENGEPEGDMELVFPPLPNNVYQVELDLRALVPDASNRDQWRIPLVIYPANSAMMSGIIVEPYTPDAPPQTRHGITMRVARVAHTPDQTALQVEITYPDTYDMLFPHEPPAVWLFDDRGHVYGHLPQKKVRHVEKMVSIPSVPGPTASSGKGTRTTTWDDVRAPLSALAHRLTYTIPEVVADVRLDASFSLDLGDDPRPGDTWPLDVTLDVAGIRVRIPWAQLRYNATEDQYMLVFPIEAQPQPDVQVMSLGLHVPGFPQGMAGGPAEQNRVIISAEKGVRPKGRFSIWVGSAMVAIRGPWTFTWDIPRPALPPSVQPVGLHPAAEATDRGITLRVAGVTLTDLVSAFDLEATVPPGTTFRGADASALVDQAGRRYERQTAVQWCRDEVTHKVLLTLEDTAPPLACARAFPHRLTFAPIPPGVERLTLPVTAVRLYRPQRAALDVTVPLPTTFDTPFRGMSAHPVDVHARLRLGDFTFRIEQGWIVHPDMPTLWLLTQPVTGKGIDNVEAVIERVQINGRDISPRLYGAHTVVWDEACATAPDACKDVPKPLLIQVPLINTPAPEQPLRVHIEFSGVAWDAQGRWDLQVPLERLFWHGKVKE